MKRIQPVLLILTLLLAACAPAATVVPPTDVPAEGAPTTVRSTQAATATAVPPTETPAPTEAPPTPTDIPPTATEVPPTVAAVEAATAAPEPTGAEIPPTATTAPPGPPAGDPAQGKAIWAAQPCSGCHGAAAEGNIGPKLAGTGLSFDQVLLQVRTGQSPMPAFTPEQISDEEVAHIFAWLKSLAAAPSPASAVRRPNYPTGALLAMWRSVNDMKVKSDFAKDLPERQR